MSDDQECEGIECEEEYPLLKMSCGVSAMECLSRLQ